MAIVVAAAILGGCFVAGCKLIMTGLVMMGGALYLAERGEEGE